LESEDFMARRSRNQIVLVLVLEGPSAREGSRPRDPLTESARYVDRENEKSSGKRLKEMHRQT
jgi:hypothetical protein